MTRTQIKQYMNITLSKLKQVLVTVKDRTVKFLNFLYCFISVLLGKNQNECSSVTAASSNTLSQLSTDLSNLNQGVKDKYGGYGELVKLVLNRVKLFVTNVIMPFLEARINILISDFNVYQPTEEATSIQESQGIYSQRKLEIHKQALNYNPGSTDQEENGNNDNNPSGNDDTADSDGSLANHSSSTSSSSDEEGTINDKRQNTNKKLSLDDISNSTSTGNKPKTSTDHKVGEATNAKDELVEQVLNDNTTIPVEEAPNPEEAKEAMKKVLNPEKK